MEKDRKIHLDASLPAPFILSQTSMPINVTLSGELPEGRIRFKSSNVAVAAVGKDGMIDAKSPGSAV